MPFEEYLRRKILEPMGMMSSRIHGIGYKPTANEASGHRWDEESKRHVRDDVVSLPVTAPDGGLTTTLSDFVRWIKIYTDSDSPVLAREYVVQMTTPQIPTRQKDARGVPQSYGYGLFLGDNLLSHPGYIVGFRSHFIFDTKKRILIAVFTNTTANDPSRIAADLLKIADSDTGE